MASLSTAPTFTSTPHSRTFAPSTSSLCYMLFLSPKKSRRKLTAVFCSAKPRRARPDYVPNRISDPLYVRVFDTTLRDGEQSPGASTTSKEKLDIARQLFKLGVDIIEVGFLAASKDDLEAVKMIAKEVGNHLH